MLAGIGDRLALFAAAVGDRHGGSRLALAGIAAGLAAALAAAAAGGTLVAPLVSPNAKALILAVALVLAGVGALSRTRLPGWAARLGPAIGGTVLAVGDRTAFVAFALAARGPAPALAAVGAFAGALVLVAAAFDVGTTGWARLPLRLLSAIAGVLLLVTGLVTGIGALRLV